MTSVKFIVNGETFTFSDSDVLSVKSNIGSNVSQEKIAGFGPGSAMLYDYSGSIKKIDIDGILTEASTTRVSGENINTIYEQKQWLESLVNGSQNKIEFESNYESQSVLSSSSATPPYQGSFTNTMCMIESITFTELTGKPNQLKFHIVLTVGN